MMSNYNNLTSSDHEGLSVIQACRIAGVGRTTLYAALASGALPARKLGRRLIILRSDLLTWMTDLPRFATRCGSSN